MKAVLKKNTAADQIRGGQGSPVHIDLFVTSAPLSVNHLVTVFVCVKGTCGLQRCEFVAACCVFCLFFSVLLFSLNVPGLWICVMKPQPVSALRNAGNLKINTLQPYRHPTPRTYFFPIPRITSLI